VTRVYVVVEGQTERAFVATVLAPVLLIRNVYLTAIRLGPPGHKGGRTSYARVKRDVCVQLKQDPRAYCSTMIDLYGLGPGFPGTPPPDHLANMAKVQHIESAFKRDICEEITGFRPDVRFIPYLQLHEYEGLLFSDPRAFAKGINQPNLVGRFQAVRDEFDSPEDINNNPQTAPSKRVIALYPAYQKVIEGTQAAGAVGIPAMKEQCHHFREWIETLERLEEL
jgi:hypothetical protein